MNFLAHVYLSPPSPAARVGNLLPDLARVRSRDRHRLAHLPGDLLAGIDDHRRVDAFTDAHPLFARSKQRVFACHGRFSGIVVDVLYDHFLARDWARYHPHPLTEFVADVYRDLTSHTHLMPPPMPAAIDAMIRENWLCAYADPAELALILRRMSRRFSRRFGREVDLEPAVAFADDAALAADFHAFFPQLIRHIGAGDTDQSPLSHTPTPWLSACLSSRS